MSNFFVPIKKAELDWSGALPISIQYDDVYHSSDGGIEQSLHVFVQGNNLIQRWQSFPKNVQSTFTIGETGFGIGLNFLLSWHLWEQYAPSSCRLHFISCEKHPLSIDDLIKSLAFWPQLAKQAEQLIANYPVLTPGYHHLSFCEGRVTLTLMLGDAFECYEQLLICGESKLEHELRTSYIDAWYLDGFAPAKNRSMWSDSLIKVIAMLSKENTTFATYTAASSVKKCLSHYGFIIEKRKGFGSKRHMICGVFTHLPEPITTKRHTPWHTGKPEKCIKKSAVIIGAGLAGCFTAFSLAKKGWKVTIIDEFDKVGHGGSANQQAVLFPKLSAYSAPLTQFMLTAFLYAVRTYQVILNQTQIGELNGALLLAYNEKEKVAQDSLRTWLFHYPELGMLIEKEQASELAGLSLLNPGLFIPHSGWINSPALCQFLANTKGISVVTNTSVTDLIFDQCWIVNNLETDVLILANGHKINSFKETEYLPIKPIRGQMTAISSTQESAQLKVPLCAEGHVLPALNNVHQIGATYELNSSIAKIKYEDDHTNLTKLKQLSLNKSWSDTVTGHWSGIRASTPDYLPIVGKIADAEKFLKQYARLETNAKCWIPQAGPYYPGLYACAGFGSRGLTSIPLCAEWLASLINNELSFLPRSLHYALSPVRFLRKNIIRAKAKID
ncbi:bifunctional tRNA (5-methylaminomethyl-2-thiouridine)(34)-methyltransferase MnmD/FAD-dependent 5-carboxymethylaminomethyl-2-thiouridine(34) oxidoreductase MnmC [Legionella longbeachae]|uniref:tRNA 5-methylaminomethyl-2-thiouridine biosynthesis bifunctional protein MnmC n=1 Tax=Legionella longbeachae serogroup 1 (strain NSW150) TaxID=661367 RepID=D3HSN3_LEGLN|nr:bifunctional tRNA (5-methylaminomethyl-2-thiouridine)(34)-methyltransferase MnmD/FAD-dependent 5-carboxymethylaminomethyl-2-thiouridine(34) oxidoreductase MnmC [Legionella longbeachae]VEE02417.1 FAD dependent oxidoreductase [Legionella oakridgensis]HBD7398093.1 bifunctional tRNA (5-methylaminomethyl-2-thiouridine)(34)-methyltransferase MnmD/FAD-dependent 5-carboxymethylaminomethyl-2-thiouridine(34) oxidoreductase MnmC [Legionella pneumophila]ARB91304.1 bifunctional tRNA (5-methylaminomethyl-2